MVQPFSHESLEVKKRFLELARKYHEKSSKEDEEVSLAFELSAALLYMNVADYLAQYLAYGVSTLAKEAIGHYYHGVISFKTEVFKDITIGESIKQLERFEFPRKADVMKVLKDANISRNKVAHTILKVKPEELPVIDEAVRKLKDDTENLIKLVDQIQLGMPPKTIWETMQE